MKPKLKKCLLLGVIVLIFSILIPYPVTIGKKCVISVVAENGEPLADTLIFRSFPMCISDSLPAGEELKTSLDGSAVFPERIRRLSLANRLVSNVIGLVRIHSGLGGHGGYTVRLPWGAIADVKGPVTWKNVSVPDKIVSFEPGGPTENGRYEITIVVRKA